ncbi:hypothetical protein SAMN04488557_3943 [Hyphomicrobium facile]|uniref:Uncharacterized protein n=1 Tax=Hyphomicrobium facile TaxID=51670 RepID=A0A1I7NW71_9HYPH|nr:hypothetical protein SAMN04488557_3943 [Hyphomicrobium facile]
MDKVALSFLLVLNLIVLVLVHQLASGPLF